jgi:glucokinase
MKACIDIGGTKVAVSLNTGAGLDLLARRSEPSAKTGDNDALARQVIRMVDEACAELGVDPSRVQRAGVSSAGPSCCGPAWWSSPAPTSAAASPGRRGVFPTTG